jgi:hypothetical protein
MLISTSSAAFPGLWLATRWPFGGVPLLWGSSVPGSVSGHPGRVRLRLPPGRGVPVASGRRCCRFQTLPWAQGDLDRLLAVGRHVGAVGAILGGMDDPEIDLRIDPSRAGSNTVTYGDPCRTGGQADDLGFSSHVSNLCPKSKEASLRLPKITESVIIACG